MHQLLISGIEQVLEQKIPSEMISALEEFTFEKTFEKKALLAEAGKTCNYQYFVLEGSCYSYYLNEKGYKNVIQMAIEGYWITDASSYFRNTPAVSTIETLEHIRVIMINKMSYEKLCCSHPLFDRFFRILLQNSLAAQHRRIAKTISEDAEYRYQEYSQRYPHFIQRIPQYLIASFLGIKPQSLSRIRKKSV